MKYVNLLNLTMQHQYITGEPVSGITIKPTDECSSLLRRFNLLFKTSAQGFDVYRLDNKEKITGVTKRFAGLIFDFKVFISDPQFCDYTSLPAKKNDETYLFSNQTTSKKSTDNLVTSTISKLEFDENTDRYLLGLVRLRVKKKPPIKVLLNFTAKAVKWKFYILSNTARGDFVIDGKLAGQPFLRWKMRKKRRIRW